jgi:NADH:ubiquinone oxidoreductase subunit 2 (subunit N)
MALRQVNVKRMLAFSGITCRLYAYDILSISNAVIIYCCMLCLQE